MVSKKVVDFSHVTFLLHLQTYLLQMVVVYIAFLVIGFSRSTKKAQEPGSLEGQAALLYRKGDVYDIGAYPLPSAFRYIKFYPVSSIL